MPPDTRNTPRPDRTAIELINLCKVFGSDAENPSYAVDHMNLKIRAGEFFTFLGPSGCGKTTTLRMIAGFEEPSGGNIVLDGREVSGSPPHLRNVNTVFQSYALFPHLTVADNVGFGLAVKRVPKAERRERIQAALASVRMAHVADRKPSALSGGQQQRVALARALVNEPSVLLLDEPFGALDLKLRREMQVEIKEMQRKLGITFIFVTHDQEEALTMSDRIAVMSSGIIRQVDDPVGIYERPCDRFTANFIGDMNMLDAKITNIDDREATVSAGELDLVLPRPLRLLGIGDTATIAIRPEALTLGAGGSETISFTGSCGTTVYTGTDRLIPITLMTGGTLTMRVRNRLGAAPVPLPGEMLTVSCPLAAIHLLTN